MERAVKKLVLVNKKDEQIGLAEKDAAHQGRGALHRAFSVYIFDDKGRLLLQQRSRRKKLWPLFWSNSCCSHPREGENYEAAGERRLREELGFTVRLRLADKFQYQASYKDIGSENEICAVLIGRYNGEAALNREEAAACKWIALKELERDISKNPARYTPWLKIALKRKFK